jgi:tetratricopeptide (TPR) repeat protein
MMRRIYILLLIICGISVQCSDSTKDANNNRQVSENDQNMNTDMRLLKLGQKFYLDPDNKAFAINYIEALITNKYYSSALKLLDEISRKFPEDKKFQELYRNALKGIYMPYDQSGPGINTIPGSTVYPEPDTLFARYSAISELDHQIKTEGHDAGLYNNRGILFLQMNNLYAAEFDFTRACQIDCSFFDSFYNKIYVKYLLDKNSEALEFLNKNEKYVGYRDDLERETIINLKKVLIDITEIDTNASLDEKTKSLEKSKIYVKLKDYNLALNELNSAIRNDDNFGDAYALRAMVFYYLDQKSAALKDLEKAEKQTGRYETPLSKMIRGK